MRTPYKEALKEIESAYTSQSTHLNLSNLHLSTLPPEIGKLTHLTTLDLSQNNLTSLPSEIGNLSNLTILNLKWNKIHTLPSEIGKLQKLTWLNLTKNRFRLPDDIYGKLPIELIQYILDRQKKQNLLLEIQKQQNSTSLNLSSQQLTSLPPEIAKLQNLIELDLSDNQLSSLPPEIGKLQKLTTLNLSRNQLTSLPPEIGGLQELHTLSLRSNQLSSLPSGIRNLQKLIKLDLSGNKFNFPEEIYAKPPQELTQYILDWQKGQKQSIHEAKIIFIGTGGVGKTSLINMLTKRHYNKDELKTAGIDITDWEIQRREDKIRLHLWDFGGQEIMYATYKFFMTKRSLYLLVTNPRTEGQYGDTDIDYWMKLIQSYAGEEVPVIVVINKCENHIFDLAKRSLQDRYPQIKAFIETSCAKGIGIKELKKAITGVINSLPHIDDTLPKSYFDIKQQLENDNRDHISYHTYKTICKEVDGEFQTLNMRILIELLHDLGIMINFRDKEEGEEISEIQVLNPTWITKGVYAVINAAKPIHQKGVIRFEDIREILDQQYIHEELKENRIIRGIKKWLGMAKPPNKELAYPTSIE